MITYNKDHTYNLSAMTKIEKDNYYDAYASIKNNMRFDSPREVVEDYISERAITDGYYE